MPMFSVRAADSAGKIHNLDISDENKDSLLRALEQRGLYPIDIQASSAEERERSIKIPQKETLNFSNSLSMLLQSGFSLQQSMEILVNKQTKKNTRHFLQHVLDELIKGINFKIAIQPFASSFPPYYLGLVGIAERIGSLESVLIDISTYLEKDKKLRDKITGALLYPVIILTVMLVGALLFAVLLFPRLVDIFRDLGGSGDGQVAEFTGKLNTMFGFLIAFPILILAMVLSIIIARQSKAASLFLDKAIFKLPLFGGFLLKKEMLNFIYSMETLTTNGVQMEEALREATHVTKNGAIQKAIGKVRRSVEKGISLEKAIQEEPLFPEELGSWIGIGEKAGTIEKVFAQLRKSLQNEIEVWSERIMTLIEPVVTITVGVVIIIFILTFIAPVFSLFGSVL